MTRSSTEETPESEIVYDVRRSGHGKGLFVKCSLHGTDANFLVDTGANATVLHPETFYSIPAENRPELQTFNGRLRMADGHLIPVIGTARILFRVHPEVPVESHAVLIAAVDSPGVLGYDFLHEHKCSLELGPGNLIIRGKKLPCIQEDQATSVSKVTLESGVVEPQCPEVVVPELIQDDLSRCKAALVEPDADIVKSKEIVQNGSVIPNLLMFVIVVVSVFLSFWMLVGFAMPCNDIFTTDSSQKIVPVRLENFLVDPWILQENAVGASEAVEEMIEDHEAAEAFCIDAADSKDGIENVGGLSEHMVRRRMTRRILRFYWPGDHHDVNSWCHCKWLDVRIKTLMEQMHVNYPLERIALEFLSALPGMLCGNYFMPEDYFTRRMELYSMRHQKAEMVDSSLVPGSFPWYRIFPHRPP